MQRSLLFFLLQLLSLSFAFGQNVRIYGALSPFVIDGTSGGFFSIAPDGSGFVGNQLDPNPTPGMQPAGKILAGSDGRLYGTTYAGGANAQGTIYSFKPDGTDFKLLRTFFALNDGGGPIADLVELPTGEIVGLNSYGGAAPNSGTVFKIKKDGTNFQAIVKFQNTSTSGNTPNSLLLGTDGKLYGTTLVGGGTAGTIFSVNTDGTAFTNLHTFPSGDGQPFSSMIQASDGKLYGTMMVDAESNPKEGAVYSINTNGTGFTKIYHFSSGPGRSPKGGVIEGIDGNLYGICVGDAADTPMTIYKLKKDGTGFGVVHVFDNTNNSLFGIQLTQTPDGFLYGIGDQAIFRVKPDGSLFETIRKHDFQYGVDPQGSTTLIGNDIWGTFAGGGTSNRGSIYKVSTATKQFKVMLNFGAGGANGLYPIAGPIYTREGNLIATSFAGGANNKGMLYKIDEDANAIKLFDFPSLDPEHNGQFIGNIIELPDGTLMGSADGVPGVDKGYGFIYTINQDGLGFKIVRSFEDYINDGYFPTSLQMGNDGFVYGVTNSGGNGDGGGLVFKMEPSGNNYHVIHRFDAFEDGMFPRAVMLASNDYLYGSTGGQGLNGSGTLYRVKTDGTGFEVLRQLDGDLNNVYSAMAEYNGKVYGLSRDGGTASSGALFSIDMTTNDVDVLFSLKPSMGMGYQPESSPIIDENGVIYAVTNFGGDWDRGTLFSINYDGTDYKMVYSFQEHTPNRNITFVYEKQEQTITFGPLEDKLATDVSFELTATASSGLPINFYSSDPAIASVVGTTVTIHSAGAVTISATQNGNDKFLPAEAVDQEFTVGKASQQITFAALANKLATDVSFDLVAAASSGLPVSYSSSDPAIASVVGKTVTIHTAGTVKITATQNGNEKYLAAQTVERELVVAKANQQISFADIADKLTLDDPFTLSATTTSSLPITFTSDNAAVATISGTTVTIKGAGVANITASQAGDDKYNAASAMKKLTVKLITAVEDDVTMKLVAYPNPGKDLFVLVYHTDVVQVNITGAAGNVIRSVTPGKISDGHCQLDLSDLSAGMYILNVNGGASVKIIKQ